MLSGVVCKTGWLLAEQAGAARPYRMQSLLGRSWWQADDLRTSVRTPFDPWLLVRRLLRDPQERAYYVVFAVADVSLAELAGVAGLRWTIETCFAIAKDELGPPPENGTKGV